VTVLVSAVDEHASLGGQPVPVPARAFGSAR